MPLTPQANDALPDPLAGHAQLIGHFRKGRCAMQAMQQLEIARRGVRRGPCQHRAQRLSVRQACIAVVTTRRSNAASGATRGTDGADVWRVVP